MSAMQYNLQFEKLCDILQLGKIVGMPEPISGGLLHKMYAINTTVGKYAIKALNPQIMLRPTAMHNFIKSERIAGVAANTIPALPSKKFNGTFMQEIDNQYYLVFDWIDGKSLKANEIKIVHCEKIGAVLADLHTMDFSALGIVENESEKEKLRDWNYYLQKGQENKAVWACLLHENIDQLCDWDRQANQSATLLASNKVISHGDLEPKNVMWNRENPIIIDWESAGYINPMQDLTETAIYWSKDGKGNIDKQRFLAFIHSYQKKYGTLQAEWRTVLATGFLGKLAWLEYSLKRSLWIECTDEKEQQLGTVQVTGTINAIRRYADMISELEKWLTG